MLILLGVVISPPQDITLDFLSKFTTRTAHKMKITTTVAVGGLADYRKVSNIMRTKYQNLNVSRLGLQLSLRNILKTSVKWRMKM